MVTNEEDIWFTKAKDDQSVYVFLTRIPDWPRGQRREFLLRSVEATPETTIGVLGQTDRLVEYNPNATRNRVFSKRTKGCSSRWSVRNGSTTTTSGPTRSS